MSIAGMTYVEIGVIGVLIFLAVLAAFISDALSDIKAELARIAKNLEARNSWDLMLELSAIHWDRDRLAYVDRDGRKLSARWDEARMQVEQRFTGKGRP